MIELNQNKSFKSARFHLVNISFLMSAQSCLIWHHTFTLKALFVKLRTWVASEEWKIRKTLRNFMCKMSFLWSWTSIETTILTNGIPSTIMELSPWISSDFNCSVCSNKCCTLQICKTDDSNMLRFSLKFTFIYYPKPPSYDL